MPAVSKTNKTPDEANAEIVLGVLSVIDQNSQITQRSVARDLDIALGLANTYLKRCVRKGYIKITQAPANRYAYYLTPKGFSEKSRLTARYLTSSFAFFRNARNQCTDLMALAASRGWNRLVLAGAGDLAEIATLCVKDHAIELVAILDPDAQVTHFAGLPVVDELSKAGGVDAVVVTDLTTPQETRKALTSILSAERVLMPRILAGIPAQIRKAPDLVL